MSEHSAAIAWRRETPDFAYETFNRDHDWTFDCGISVRASSAPDYFGVASCVDPEEAFVASLASCHMLTFLALASKKRILVDRYEDEAVGVLDKNEEGRLAVTKVTLRPRIVFSGENIPGPDDLKQLHDRAHRACFIANSVKTEVVVEPRE